MFFNKSSNNLPYEKVGKEVRCIADEIPFEIPDSWEWVRLETAILTEMGQSPSGDSVSNISSGVEFHQGKVFFGEKFLQKSNQTTSQPSKIVEAGTILLCVRAPVGKVNITQRKICIGRGLCGIAPIIDIESDFLYYLLESYENIFIKKATGTTFVAITAEVVKKQLIPLPPLPEQKRIVAKIEELLPHIEEYGKAESKVSKLNAEFPEQLKKSILQWAIQGKLVPQNPDDEPASVLLERIRAEKAKLVKEGKIKKDKNESVIFRRDNSHYEKLNGVERCIDDEIPFEIPENWSWTRLGNVCKSVSDGDHQPPPQTKQGIPFLVISDVSQGKLSFENTRFVSQEYYNGLQDMRKPQCGDILFTVTGSFGIVIKVDCNLSFCFQRHIALLKMTKLIDVAYFCHLLSSPLVYEQCRLKATGTAQKTVGLQTLRSILLPLPPLAEQQRIVKAIESVCKKMTI